MSVAYGSREYFEERVALAATTYGHRRNYLEALEEASSHLNAAVEAYSAMLGPYDDGTLAALASVVGRVVSLSTAAQARQNVARATLKELQAKLTAMPVGSGGGVGL